VLESIAQENDSTVMKLGEHCQWIQHQSARGLTLSNPDPDIPCCGNAGLTDSGTLPDIPATAQSGTARVCPTRQRVSAQSSRQRAGDLAESNNRTAKRKRGSLEFSAIPQPRAGATTQRGHSTRTYKHSCQCAASVARNLRRCWAPWPQEQDGAEGRQQQGRTANGTGSAPVACGPFQCSGGDDGLLCRRRAEQCWRQRCHRCDCRCAQQLSLSGCTSAHVTGAMGAERSAATLCGSAGPCPGFWLAERSSSFPVWQSAAAWPRRWRLRLWSTRRLRRRRLNSAWRGQLDHCRRWQL
jgi:hypothetical protein